uniref:Uncharacterized protein n=1 Tax=Cannabis sativa TaxID=3483 RepID=A0A803QC36_CANSA
MAQEVLQLPLDDWNISLLAIEANFITYKIYPSDQGQGAEQAVGEPMPAYEGGVTSEQETLRVPQGDQVPIERAIRIRDSPEKMMLCALKKRSGDASGQKSPVKCSKVDDMPPKSIIPSTKTPQLTVEKSLVIPPTEVYEEAVSNVNPLAKKNSKSKSTVAPSKGSKGGSTDGLGLPKPLATPTILNLETKKRKEMLQFY